MRITGKKQVGENSKNLTFFVQDAFFFYQITPQQKLLDYLSPILPSDISLNSRILQDWVL